MDAKVLEANILTGKSGATYGSAGQQLGKWQGILKENDPNAELIGVPFPTASQDIMPRFSGVQAKYPNNNCVAISTSCKVPDIAAKYLDYGYGEEGHMLNNFGVEGVSYNMVDGYPTYTDEIMHNPDGLPINQAMGKHFRASYSGPFVQDKRYIEQYYSTPQQKEAQAQWSLGLEEELKYQLPKVLATEEESKEVSRITNELNTYRSSMTIKFILGTEDLNGFDAYVQELKNIGVDRINEIYDAAIERDNQR